jgi:hypothetical protein
VRPLAGDGADLADLVAAAAQVGADGCVVSANLGRQFAQRYKVYGGTPFAARYAPLRHTTPALSCQSAANSGH